MIGLLLFVTVVTLIVVSRLAAARRDQVDEKEAAEAAAHWAEIRRLLHRGTQ